MKVLLISNRVMHYRIPVYNYFHRRFRDYGVEFSVLTNRVDRLNWQSANFEIHELPFDFWKYRKAVSAMRPSAVILFLHLKDVVLWPLIHWLKMQNIPVAFWTKGGNWDAKDSRLRYALFNYIHGVSDGLILYSDACRDWIRPIYRAKAFVANNTVNFEDYPEILQSKEELKKEFGIRFEKVVLFMGNMGDGAQRKRVDHLIDIFRTLERRDVGLLLAGHGLSDELQKRLNPANTFHMGELSDLQISKLCKLADVCAIPGHVGLGLNQAFYWGLPVITEERDDHPPERGYLKHGRNGIVVDADDLTTFRQRLLALLDDDALRSTLSKNAREDILREASIEGMFCGFKQCVDFMTGGSN